METTVAIPERPLSAGLQSQRDVLVIWGRELKVASSDDCTTAEAKLVVVMALHKAITDWFEPMVEAAMESKRKAEATRKAIVDKRDKELRPLVEVKALAGQKTLVWRQEQEVRAEAYRARQLAEARKAAEDEQLRKAQEAAAAGDRELADAILNEAPAITVAAAPLPPELAPPDRTVGLRRVSRPEAEIIDRRACAMWCAQNDLIPPDVLLKCIGPTVRAQREACMIPGVRVHMVETIESSGGR